MAQKKQKEEAAAGEKNMEGTRDVERVYGTYGGVQLGEGG